ncbi:MAG: prepilin-type N-terminal cleavage/methylation domain-containing protein [Deltaproteobacteria bacterium]|nr:prepilin-type N-terminal cleavage/methylation domain-containing protein [Deltaproteobacteria bacterium]
MKKEKGFTFLETILAILIVGIGLLGITNLFQRSVSQSVDTERVLQATQLARERLEQLLFDKKMRGYDYVVSSSYPVTENLGGLFAPFSRTISIREVRSNDLDQTQAGTGYKRVLVTVSWPVGRQVALETLMTKWME